MKRKLSLFLALLMIAMVAVTSVASANTYYIKSSNGKGVYVRSNPWKADNNILTSLPYGTAVNLEYWVNNEWAAITLVTGSDIGYVMRRFLVKDYPGAYVPPKNPTTNTNASGDVYSAMRYVDSYSATVKNSRSGAVVKLRWAPSKSAAVMTTMYPGDTVTVLAVSKDWYQVQDQETGMVGFLNTAFIND